MVRARVISISLCFLLAMPWLVAQADETSSGDKLRILYSNRFTFTDDGYPLVTIELMSEQDEVRLSSAAGVIVQPDGEGGSEISAGQEWTVTVEDARPAVIREWTVVDSVPPGDHKAVAASMQRWRERGFQPHTFEVGTVFGVEGEVLDSRELLVVVAPVDAPLGGKQARAIASKYALDTRVHRELVERPRGTIVARSSGIEVRNPSVIWFAPKQAGATLTLRDVVVGRGGSQLQVGRETRHYLGRIYVTLGEDGRLVVVNAVPADRLLAGLVPSEIYPDASHAALAAQAIAARTELLQKIGTRHLTDPYLLCSHQHCQVYSGAGKEHPRTTQAVAETRGQVLLRAEGGLVDARYSASCGGHGEHNDNIWGGAPDLALRGHLDIGAGQQVGKNFSKGIDDQNIEDFLALEPSKSYCGVTRYGKGRFRWTQRVDSDELSRRVAVSYPNIGKVRALKPVDRGISGRIKELLIIGDKGRASAVGDLHIRRLLGGLRSTLFVVQAVGSSASPTAFEFRGAGFGHGVGMCQIGAIGMAESGKSFASILRHYYPGSRIKRLY